MSRSTSLTRRLFVATAALIVAVSLSACGVSAPEVAAPSPTVTATPTPTATPTETPTPTPEPVVEPVGPDCADAQELSYLGYNDPVWIAFYTTYFGGNEQDAVNWLQDPCGIPLE